jgi:hypothetical protein
MPTIITAPIVSVCLLACFPVKALYYYVMNMRNVVGLSLAHSKDPAAFEKRAADILGISNAAKRMGALTLHHLVEIAPAMMGKFVPDYDGSYEFIGSGGTATVLRKPESPEVIKVMRSTIDMSETDRQITASSLDTQFRALSKYLGAFVLPQEVSVGAHPMVPHVRAVMVTQPYSESYSPLSLFVPETLRINRSGLESNLAASPSLGTQLSDFINASRELDASSAMLPDTYNAENLGLAGNADGPALVLIDGQPLSAEAHSVQHRWIAQQLLILEGALGAAA